MKPYKVVDQLDVLASSFTEEPKVRTSKPMKPYRIEDQLDVLASSFTDDRGTRMNTFGNRDSISMSKILPPIE